MQLRNHPFMRRHGITNWPPVWTQPKKYGNKTKRGEVGVLTYVFTKNNTTNRGHLVIEPENERYVGSLIFDDVEFCWLISNALQNHVGRSVRNIGDLDLSYTL